LVANNGATKKLGSGTKVFDVKPKRESILEDGEEGARSSRKDVVVDIHG
jgi:hypothetical protein